MLVSVCFFSLKKHILFFSCVCLFVPGVYVIKIIIIRQSCSIPSSTPYPYGVVVISPQPWPLLVGEVRSCCSSPTSQHLRPSGQQFRHYSGVYPHFQSDNVVRMWVQLKRWCVSYVLVLQRRHSGDGCDLASTLCKYDFRKGYLFVLSWAIVRRVWREVSLQICNGVRSILLLLLVARCQETIDVCIWRMLVLCLL